MAARHGRWHWSDKIMTVMYAAVWNAKVYWAYHDWNAQQKKHDKWVRFVRVLHDSWWNCSQMLSCQCYILIKNCCDNWCFRSLAEMEPVCSLPSSHKLHFLTTRSGDHKSWQLVWYSSVPPVSWPLPHLYPGLYIFILSRSRGVNSHKQNPGSCIYVRHCVTINS